MRINEAFPENYIKCSDLAGKNITLTIREVKMEELGKDKEVKPILYFLKTEKGLALNKTNANTIADNLGSDEMDEWVGKQVTLIPAQTDFQGKQVACIRIRLVPRGARPAPLAKPAAPPPPAPEEMAEPSPDDLPDDVPF